MIQYLSIFLFIFSTTVSYGQIINRGPYLQVLSPESIQICWRTDVPTTSRSAFGTELSAQEQVVLD